MAPPSYSSLLHGGGSLKLSENCFSPFGFHSNAVSKQEFGSRRQTCFTLQMTKSRATHLLANPNATRSNKSSKKVVIMVDPLEAKRLAAIEMEEIKTKQRLQSRHQIEAINGAWAMIGLTAALVIEGLTGKSILDQLAGYLDAAVGFVMR
ncbi:unnamed protein product [Cuscuta epithymum]|uniref:Uncharacterized protein n=1 Tax=Cuscuta epithymum TaxID=186058 RepID=A0AAV0CMU0_9ASTE|nr:unnamed protein product [Cuscuta epithymum]